MKGASVLGRKKEGLASALEMRENIRDHRLRRFEVNQNRHKQSKSGNMKEFHADSSSRDWDRKSIAEEEEEISVVIIELLK